MGDEVPQVLGGPDPAGEAAGDADDRERFAVGRRAGRGTGRRAAGGRRTGGARAGQLRQQVRAELVGGGVVEGEGAGQPQTGGRREAVAQFYGGEGREAEVAEGAVRRTRPGVGVSEDGGGVGGDEREEGVVLFGRGQVVQAGAQLPGGVGGDGAGRAGRGGGGGQLAGVRGGLAPLPVDVGDDELGVRPGGGPFQGGQRQVGRHGEEAAGAQVRLRRAGVRESVAAPVAPGEGGRGQPAGPAVVGEGVQVGVRGGVVGLSRGAEGGRDGGEEDERVEGQVLGEGVQVVRRVRLRSEDRAEVLRGLRGERVVVQDAGGVDHRGERVARRDGGDDGGERVGVGDVARGDGGGGAVAGEAAVQRVGAGRVGAAAADQQQVAVRVAVGDAGGELGGDGARAAGDEDGAAGRPGRRYVGGGLGCGLGGAGEAAGAGPGGTYGQFVLVVAVGQGGGEVPHILFDEGGGEVDEPAPQVGVLQGSGPPQPPDHGLPGVVQEVAGGGGDGAAGGAPQPGRYVVTAGERLDQGEGEGRSGGDVGVPRVRFLVECEQREHAADGGARVLHRLGEEPVEDLGVDAVVVQDEGDGGQARVAQAVEERGDVRPVGVPGGDGDQPGRGRPGPGVGEVDRPPGVAVAPGVGGGLVAAPRAPGRQGRQEGVQPGVRREVEEGGHGVRVLALDGLPERGGRAVRGLVRAPGPGRARCGGGQPVALALEGVGGQVGGVGWGGGGEVVVPGDGESVGVGAGQGGQHAAGVVLVAAQGGDDGDRHARAVGGFVHRGRQRGMRADLDVGVESLAGQGFDGIAEAHRLPQVAVPVLRARAAVAVAGGVGVVHPAAVHGGVPRDRGRPQGEAVQRFQQFLAHGLDVGGVRGVVDRDQPRLRRAGGKGAGEVLHRLLDRGEVAADGRGPRPVDRPDPQPARPVPGHLLAHRVRRRRDRGHAALPPDGPHRPAAHHGQSGGVLQ
ncbi:hypothetical protein RKE29_23615 [Streptomyces sp. B1866]|nr:hypothetical protein [Streptomyces sp. B1866]MDT3399595.1 hypothetical protein [Streptomyces sp. B1866]